MAVNARCPSGGIDFKSWAHSILDEARDGLHQSDLNVRMALQILGEPVELSQSDTHPFSTKEHAGANA